MKVDMCLLSQRAGVGQQSEMSEQDRPKLFTGILRLVSKNIKGMLLREMLFEEWNRIFPSLSSAIWRSQFTKPKYGRTCR